MKRYELADKLYFIVKGYVYFLASDNSTVLNMLTEGFFFGEVGILLTGTRTCSVVAKTSCIFYTINKKDLTTAIEKNPIQYKILYEIAR